MKANYQIANYFSAFEQTSTTAHYNTEVLRGSDVALAYDPKREFITIEQRILRGDFPGWLPLSAPDYNQSLAGTDQGLKAHVARALNA